MYSVCGAGTCDNLNSVLLEFSNTGPRALADGSMPLKDGLLYHRCCALTFLLHEHIFANVQIKKEFQQKLINRKHKIFILLIHSI